MTEDRASEPRTAARMSAADRKPNRSDLWLVAALTVGSLIFAILYEGSGFWEFKAPLWAVCTLSVVVTVPLLWRRRFPNLVAWFITTLYVTA